MKKRLISAALVVALLVVAAVFTIQAAPNATSTEAIQMTTDGVFTAGGTVNARCPVCKRDVNWLPLQSKTQFNSTTDTHYYLAGPVSRTSLLYTQTAGTYCLHLNGQNLTSSNRGLVITNGSIVNVMGNGTITGVGQNATGAALEMYEGKAYLYGGTLTSSVTTRPVVSFGNAKAYVYMYGADIKGNGNVGVLLSQGYLYQYDGAIYNGKSNVKMTGGQFNMLGGEIYGGNAAGGGNVRIEGGSFAMNNDAVIRGGVATSIGGNIYIQGGSAFLLGGTVENGSAPNGGNIYINNANSEVKLYSGNPVVTGGSATTGNGGNIYVNTGKLTIEKGEISDGTAAANGGNIGFNAGTLNMSNGTVSIGETGGANLGGNIFLNGCTANITGGSVTGGKATTSGGNIYVNNSTLTLNNSTQEAALISSGSAKTGGNIFVISGTVDLVNGKISGGAATSTGGSIHVDGGNVNLQGGTVENGSAPNGGNIYVNKATSTVTVSGATVTGGETTGSGGNVHVAAGTLDIQSGTISLGTAGGYGGNIYTVGTLKMSGGLVSEGTCNYTLSNNWYSYGGGNIMVNGGTASISGGTVKDGKTPNAGGGNICARAPLTISGTAQITGGEAHTGGNISSPASAANLTISGGTISGGKATDATYGGDTVYAFGGQLNITGGEISHAKAQFSTAVTLGGAANVDTLAVYTSTNTPTLNVAANYTGTSTLEFHSANYGDHTYGSTLNTEYFTADGAFTGTLLLDTDMVDAQVFGTDAKTLVVAGAQIVGGETSRWALNGTTAAAAAENGEYVKLYTNDSIDLGSKDTYIDFNGLDVTVTGEGKLYGMDSTATTDAAGDAVVTGMTAERVAYNPETGLAYVAVTDANGTTFHPVSVRINGVSVRTATAGVYFSAEFKANPTVAAKITGFGVAMNAYELPGVDFQEDANSLYTAYANEAFENNGTVTGVVIHNILKKDAENNDARGKNSIFAQAYMIIGEDTLIMDNGVEYSLYDVLHLIDAREALYTANEAVLAAFYQKWNAVMSGWDFQRIGK